MSARFPVFFTMHFSFADDTEASYGFAGSVPVTHLDAAREGVCDMHDWYDFIFHDLEDAYGVHDWCSSPDKRVLCLGSYYTSEVEPDDVQPLMQAWRERLAQVSEIAALFGQVVALSNHEMVSDWERYESIVAAGSLPQEV